MQAVLRGRIASRLKERGIKNTDDTAFRSFFVSTSKSMEVIGHA